MILSHACLPIPALPHVSLALQEIYYHVTFLKSTKNPKNSLQKLDMLYVTIIIRLSLIRS